MAIGFGRLPPTSALWRVPLGLLVSIVPPLGLIGWASPTVAAGLLFPATGYVGFVVTLFIPGCLAVFPKLTIVCAAVLALGCNVIHPRSPEAPTGWQGINTQYGGVAHERVDPVREYQIAEDLKARALASTGSRHCLSRISTAPLDTGIGPVLGRHDRRVKVMPARLS